MAMFLKQLFIRQEKEFIGVKDDLKLSLNAVKVLEARYLFKDSEGKIIETPKQMFHRVAVHLGIIQGLYDYISYRKTVFKTLFILHHECKNKST